MGNSLFDQLKGAGLVDEKKAKKVKKEKYKQQKQQIKQKQGVEPDEAKALAQAAQAEKVKRDRELNQQRQEEAERRAIAAQIRQLIENNCIADRDGELAYNFTDNNKIKSLYVNETVHKQLGKGRLAIVRLGEGYELVALPVAEKIQQRDPELVVMLEQSSNDQPDEDDPYADYQIPDDLMW